MALFKIAMTEYHISHFCQDNYLALHCSRYDNIKAPFDGELIIDKDTCILKKNNFELHIANIDSVTSGKVKAGDEIAIPKVGGDNRAYFYIKLYKDSQLEDILMYLGYKDKTEETSDVKIKVEEKPKTTKKKTTSKKKSNKK